MDDAKKAQLALALAIISGRKVQLTDGELDALYGQEYSRWNYNQPEIKEQAEIVLFGFITGEKHGN